MRTRQEIGKPRPLIQIKCPDGAAAAFGLGIASAPLRLGVYSRSDGKVIVVVCDLEHQLPGAFGVHLLGQDANFFGSLPPMFRVVEMRGDGHETHPFLGHTPAREMRYGLRPAPVADKRIRNIWGKGA